MSMPVIKNSGTSRCNAISDVIESIALQQTGLSHILNAEGEKIQAIIKYSEKPEDLLLVNKSVENMVNSITRLEFMLQGKLELFKDCLCTNCEIKNSDIVLELLNTNGGVITDNGNNVFMYTPSGEETKILFNIGPNDTIELIDELPSKLEFNDNILYIPANYDWSQVYTMKFLVTTENGTYTVTLYNQIAE